MASTALLRTRWLIWLVVAWGVAVATAPRLGEAAPLPPARAGGATGDVETVGRLLEQRLVRARLRALGVSEADFAALWARLSPGERSELAARVEEVGTGGDAAAAIAVAIIVAMLVILALELLGRRVISRREGRGADERRRRAATAVERAPAPLSPPRRDASGAWVAAPAAPQRIVSLVPSLTELLFLLDLEDRVAGVTAYCTEPRDRVARKPRVGREKDPDSARILALEPDLVVANLEENRREVVEALRAAGVPVWVTFPRTVTEGIALIREIGTLTGADARAEVLARPLEAAHAAARARAAAGEPVRVFCPIWRDPYMTISGDTYVHDVLAACGGRNVFADDPARYPTVTLDQVRRAAPEVILLPDEPYRFRPAHLRDFAPLADVPAVRAGRIHFVDGKLLTWHGPRVGDALARLPDLLSAAPDDARR